MLPDISLGAAKMLPHGGYVVALKDCIVVSNVTLA